MKLESEKNTDIAKPSYYLLRRVRRQRGASLLEAVAYLGIAAIVILGAISLLRTAFGGANTNRVATEISTLETNTRRLFSVRGVFPGGNFTDTLVSAGLVPGSLPQDASNTKALINAFQGRTAVGGAAASSAEGSNFWIIYTNVPKEACLSLVTNSTAQYVQVGTSSSPTTFSTTPTALPTSTSSSILKTPIAVSAASTACTNAQSEVIFYF